MTEREAIGCEEERKIRHREEGGIEGGVIERTKEGGGVMFLIKSMGMMKAKPHYLS